MNYSRSKKRKPPRVRERWTKPREDYVKLNVDVCYDVNSGTGSCGAIIRDHRGMFIGACNRTIPFVSDAPSAEAMGLRDGLLLAGQIGCNRIEINSDCIEVIDTMNDGGNSLGPAAAIYEECNFLGRNFADAKFVHCPREANVAADLLARNAEGPMSVVWHEEPPDFLVHVIANDVAIL
jgi:ribonuclease HI